MYLNVMELLLKEKPYENKNCNSIDLVPNCEPLVRRYAPIWRDWEKAYWIQDDGSVDPKTWNALRLYFVNKYDETTTFKANWITPEGIWVYVMEYDQDSVLIFTKNFEGPETVWSFGMLNF